MSAANPTREAVANAILSLINAPMTSAGAVKITRRLLHWADVPAQEQPFVALAAAQHIPQESPAGLPPIWRSTFHIYIYATEPDPSASPSTKINNLLDALEAALAPSVLGQKQTLGGLVEHCWISGSIETDEGVLGAQGMAIVPIEVLYS